MHLEGRGAPGDQVAPTQSLDTLDHLTHGRSWPKGRVPLGLKLVTPRQIHRTLTQDDDLCNIRTEKGSALLPLGPDSQAPLSH